MLVSLLFSVVLCHILKDIFDRTRPYIELGIEILVSPPLGSSFPSAHSSTAFSFATVMFLFYRKSAPWFAVCSVLLASAVAFSRIWLCVHYLSDVVVGAMFGVAVGITIFLIFQTVKKIRSK